MSVWPPKKSIFSLAANFAYGRAEALRNYFGSLTHILETDGQALPGGGRRYYCRTQGSLVATHARIDHGACAVGH